MTIRLVIPVFVFGLPFLTIFADDPCRFEYPGKGVIDLTSVGRTDGTPAFADKVPPLAPYYKYSYNPCKPFSEGSACQNVAACQTSLNGQYAYAIGKQETASWNPGKETSLPSISYTNDDKTVIVSLKCSSGGAEEFEVLGEDPIGTFLFRLTHKCACWDGCLTTTTTTTTTTKTTTSQPITTPCRFEYPGKGVIDFSFIGRTDLKAAYADETTRTTSDFKYSYNPCRSFSEGTECIGVAVCKMSYDERYTFPLGTQESALWNAGSDLDNTPSVSYSYGNNKATILLQCSAEGNNEFEAFGEDPVNTYRFRLMHKCACWDGCSNMTSTSDT